MISFKHISFLLLAGLFLLISNTIPAQHIQPVRTMVVPHAFQPIILDGICDEPVWSDTSEVSDIFVGKENWFGPSDLSAFIKLCADYYNLYLYVEINDDTLEIFNGTDNIRNFDNIEVYLDTDTTISSTNNFNTDAIQIRYNRGLDTVTGTTPRNDARLDNFVIIDTNGIWRLEAAIPWVCFMPDSTTPDDVPPDIFDKDIGFDVNITDADSLGKITRSGWDADTSIGKTSESRMVEDVSSFGVIRYNYYENLDSWSPSGIQQNFSGTKFFPNPTNSYINIESPEIINRVDIITISGEIIRNYVLSESQAMINLQGLPPGNYFMRIYTESKVRTEKIVLY